jgi:lysophospholipase L1-like esterase
MSQWNSAHSGRGQLVPSYADIIVTYGRNDLTNGVELATLQSRFNTLVSDLRALNSSARIWSCTVFPKTSSTDTWQTEANQTVEAGTEAARVAFNEWLRAGVSGVYSNLDVASAVETTSNGGKWRVDEIAWQGACSAAGSTTIDIAASEWSTNQWVNGATVVITSGAGAGQRRVIASNTATRLTVSAWDTVPSPGDTMQIMPLYTTDGIHAAQYGYVAIARAMDVAHRHGRLASRRRPVAKLAMLVAPPGPDPAAAHGAALRQRTRRRAVFEGRPSRGLGQLPRPAGPPAARADEKADARRLGPAGVRGQGR